MKIKVNFAVLRPTVVMLGIAGVMAVEVALFSVPTFELARKHLEIGSSAAVTCEMVSVKLYNILFHIT